jgi:hypothetical protein
MKPERMKTLESVKRARPSRAPRRFTGYSLTDGLAVAFFSRLRGISLIGIPHCMTCTGCIRHYDITLNSSRDTGTSTAT